MFEPQSGPPERLLPRWLFLRALGAIYFSAFYSLVFQIRGLIGPNGILPADHYLEMVAQSLGSWERLWYAPTLLWWSSTNGAVMAICWVGLIASILLFLNLWPRGALIICFVCFLSFIAAAQDFSSYQSDGMLLEAGFLSLFFAPSGLRPGLGRLHPAARASLFLLLWEWFRIYFESGVVKILSGDPEWRNFTAMDDYYQNGPLPTWIGWYVQHLPHWFHAATVFATLGLELVLVWMLFLPRRVRIICFFIVTPWQIGVILTANYTFLNYLVLALGVLLLDDKFVLRCVPAKWRERFTVRASEPPTAAVGQELAATPSENETSVPPSLTLHEKLRRSWKIVSLSVSAVMLLWIFYDTTAEMLMKIPLPTQPIIALDPFRIANRYGLFAVMTRGRYEIEFQGSNDGETWTPYPFRYKPQALNETPRIYAPYQPRFDWNLWFASLGGWREYPIVPNAEVRLLQGDKDVLALFAANPFGDGPPRKIRVLLWQYWFTSLDEKRATGHWWRRELLGLYAPTIERMPDGQMQVIDWPTVQPRE
jgi:lipase maturation factor 1